MGLYRGKDTIFLDILLYLEQANFQLSATIPAKPSIAQAILTQKQRAKKTKSVQIKKSNITPFWTLFTLLAPQSRAM